MSCSETTFVCRVCLSPAEVVFFKRQNRVLVDQERAFKTKPVHFPGRR